MLARPQHAFSAFFCSSIGNGADDYVGFGLAFRQVMNSGSADSRDVSNAACPIRITKRSGELHIIDDLPPRITKRKGALKRGFRAKAWKMRVQKRLASIAEHSTMTLRNPVASGRKQCRRPHETHGDACKRRALLVANN